MTYGSLIDYFQHYSRHAGETAFVCPRGYRKVRWSYREIVDVASQVALELVTRNIRKGDRVIIWADNSAEWVAAFWGAVLHGAVVVPMDRTASAEFARAVHSQVSAKIVFCSRELSPAIPDASILVLDDLRQAVAHHSEVSPPSPPLSRYDTAQIVFTSGTTAEPAGVVISHGNILANLEPLESEINKYLVYARIVHPLRFLNLLPLSHVFGQFLSLFVPSLLGATIVFQDSLNPAEIMHTIRQERVSVLVTVPRVLESLKGKIERDADASGQLGDLSQRLAAAEGKPFLTRWWQFRNIHRRFGWKFWALISGGAALDPAIEAFWGRLGYAVIQGYGLTETTSMVSVNHPFRLGKGSIGKVLPGREVKLDPSGEILVRGESVAVDIWRNPQKDEPEVPDRLQDGWLYTGDVGEMDSDGNLYFKGRKKNVIVTAGGMNIYPEDLETTLRQQPEVRDCVVVGMVREGNAEPCAVLILRDPAVDPAGIVNRANARLAEYQRIHHWFVWENDDFPRTRTLKPRTVVIQQAVQERLRDKETVRPAGGILSDLIVRITGRTPAALSPEARLDTDLNLNSLDRVELLSAIEDRYQLDLNESHFAASTTVAELEQVLRQPPPVRTEFTYPHWAQRWPITWLRTSAYYLLVAPVIHLLAWPRVWGREHLRGVPSPLLMISNHVTYLDVGFILAALPPRFRHRLVVAMAGELLREMRHPSLDVGLLERMLEKTGYALAVSLFNVFPLPQKSGFRQSFTFAGESADRGYNVLVFPEGRRTPDGNLSAFRSGIGLLASKLNLPVVPIYIHGLWELKQAGRKAARPGAIRIKIGPVVRFPADIGPDEIVRILEARMEDLRANR